MVIVKNQHEKIWLKIFKVSIKKKKKKSWPGFYCD